MTDAANLNPDPSELADDLDDLDWDRAKHGRMLAAATPGDTVTTVPFVLEDNQ